jgi:formate dehydrogenase
MGIFTDNAPNLKLVVTAGVGSDHIDLAAAASSKITTAEITGNNVISLDEQVIMHILALVRNYILSYKQNIEGRWDKKDVIVIASSFTCTVIFIN